MRPIKIKHPSRWIGDVRYRVLTPEWPADVRHEAPPPDGGDHVFAWTMDEVDTFLAILATEREPEQAAGAAPPTDKKTCPGCGRVLPLASFNRRAASPDGRERLCRRCSREKAREWRKNAAAEGYGK